MEKEIKLPSGRYGRGDICDVKTGEVWEIKYAGLAAVAAPAQLALYATGTYKSSGVHVIIGSEMFVGYFVVDNIEITYWTEPGGIILYDFNILNEWKPVTIREKARTRSISKEAIATTAMCGSIALACCIGSQLNGVGLVADSLQFERYLQ